MRSWTKKFPIVILGLGWTLMWPVVLAAYFIKGFAEAHEEWFEGFAMINEERRRRKKDRKKKLL